MSSIIKSSQAGAAAIGEFAFKPINHAVAGRVPEEKRTGFLPMGLFDSSELDGGQSGEGHEIEEPPVVTVTEEELDRQLREAFQNGLAEGKNLAERGLINVFRSLRTATEGIEDLRERILRESEDELVQLVMMISRKVIMKEVSLDRSILSGVVQAGIAAVAERDQITIRLNPDDYILATTGHGEILHKELITDRMQLKSDSSVMQGSCLIDSEMGTIDAGIDAQLDEILRRMLEERLISPPEVVE